MKKDFFPDLFSIIKKLAEIDIRIRGLKNKDKLDSSEGETLAAEFKVLSQVVDWAF